MDDFEEFAAKNKVICSGQFGKERSDDEDEPQKSRVHTFPLDRRNRNCYGLSRLPKVCSRFQDYYHALTIWISECCELYANKEIWPMRKKLL